MRINNDGVVLTPNRFAKTKNKPNPRQILRKYINK